MAQRFAGAVMWMAEKTEFRVEPAIPTDDTKPGYRSVARGSEIVGQSLDGQSDSLIDGLVFRSKYLPPNNSDFGKKKVYLEVDGKEVDYADVEVFYPPDATNHPSSVMGYEIVVAFGERCLMPPPTIKVPSWFYYYSQAYPAHDVSYAQDLGGADGLTCGTTIYISSKVSPSFGEMQLFLFRKVGGRLRLADERLAVRGILKFVAVVEHERVHKRMCEMRVLNLGACRNNIVDNDGDKVEDEFERACRLLDPTRRETVRGIPDAELIAYIVEYPMVIEAVRRKLWELDWAQHGLQWGYPVSPFPVAYVRPDGRRYTRSQYNDLVETVPGCLFGR
jgi:hypothetical protein